MSKIKREEIKKILCIKPRGIGDIILSTIVLENIKAAFPHSEVHYLTEEFSKRAVENNPFVSKILTFNKKDFVLSIIRKVRKEKYDLILDLWSNPKTAQVTFFSGAKYRVGFEKRSRRYAYNIRAENLNHEIHSAEVNLQLLDSLEVPVNTKNIHFYLNDEEKEFAKKYFEHNFTGTKLTIGIIPSGGWDSKRCDAEKWIEFCKTIYEELIKCKFLILWGPGDESDAFNIYNSIKDYSVLAPETTVGFMAGLISKCDLVIANDSGPMHIAAALKVPTLGIFGPTNPKLHRPFSSNSDFVIKADLNCILCNKLKCPYKHECMKELSVDDFKVKVRNLLGIL